MSQISRAWHDGATTIDVRLLAEIEGALMVDGEPGVSVVAPLWARVEAHREACTDPEFDAQLVADTQAAMGWLTLYEAHAVQQLRGWNRARYGRITVSAGWLSEVRNVLDGLTLSLGSTCEDELKELDYEGGADLLAAAAERYRKTGYCGECQWCTVLRLRDEADAVLDTSVCRESSGCCSYYWAYR